MEVIFYTKPDCHLCEEAYRILIEMAYDYMPLEIDVMDITHAHHTGLREKYGDTVPVISRLDFESELAWPFTPDELKAYLNL